MTKWLIGIHKEMPRGMDYVWQPEGGPYFSFIRIDERVVLELDD